MRKCRGCRQKLATTEYDATARGRLKGACRQCCATMRDLQEDRRAVKDVPWFKWTRTALRKRIQQGEEIQLEALYSSKPSEFEVQAFVYRHLREMGFRARGEVRAKGTNLFRLDIGVFEAGTKRLLLILEIKKAERPTPEARKKAKNQAALYRLFGVPVYLIWGIPGGRRFLEHVRAHGLPMNGWE